jgi:hypothetical protein
MNTNRKFSLAIALIIFAVVVFMLPISLFMRNFGNLLFDPASVKSFVANTIDTDFVASLASDMVRERLLQEAESDNPVSVFLQRSLEGLDEEAWGQIVTRFAPPEIIISTTGVLVDSFVEWLQSDNPPSVVFIDLSPWKDNLQSGPDELVTIVLNTLPPCTAEELGNQLLEGLSAETALPGLIPLCNPPEPLYSALLSGADSIVQSAIERIPNEFQLDLSNLEAFESLELLKDNLKRVRSLLMNAWLYALVLSALSVILGASRNWLLALKWAGWLFVLSGFVTLLLSQNLDVLAGPLLQRIIALMFEQSPLLFAEILNAMAEKVLQALGHRLVLQSILLLALGLSALISWNLLPQIQSQVNKSTLENNDKQLG